MGYTVPNDGTTIPEGEFNNEPLPKGKYQATILPTKKDSATIEKRAAAKNGPNSKLGVLAVRFRISDGQKGAGRNVFADIPMFRKWTATGQGKYPQGTPAFLFFQFFRSLGYDVDAAEGFTIPDDRELLGKSVELVLDIEKQEGFEPRNRVQFINKHNPDAASGATASSTPAVSADVWGSSAAEPSSADVWAPSAPDAGGDVWGADSALSAAAAGGNGF